MIKVGVARHHDTLTAINEVVEQCGAHSAALVLVFAARRHNPVQVLSALRATIPSVPTFGGSVVGTVIRDVASYGGYEIAALAFAAGPDLPQVVTSRSCETTDKGIGHSLGSAIALASKEPRAVLMFYTSVLNTASHHLHHGTNILAGLLEGLGSVKYDVAGGGLLTDFNFDDSWFITPNGICKHGAFALIFPSHLRFETQVLSACRPVGPPMTITAINGARVLSLDDIPALDLLCTVLGRDPSLNGNTLGLNICLGLFKSSSRKFIPSNGEINRVVVFEDITDRSISLLEPDFNVGDQVRFMLLDNEYMMSLAENVLRSSSIDIMFSLYIDCAGRASVLTGTTKEESIIAISSLSTNAPALGIYSGVEIASRGQAPHALDLTGVMISVVRNYFIKADE